jgi:hypothetical protein
MNAPKRVWIYHIIHVDDFPSVVESQALNALSSETESKPQVSLSNPEIEQRRLKELTLASHPDLHVGDFVPFNFCPRSVSLYFINRKHRKLPYQDGQEPIVHLVADFHAAVDWAVNNGQRWAFTSSCASSYYFMDFSDVNKIDFLNWKAIESSFEKRFKDVKQSEALFEKKFPWSLIKAIGVFSQKVKDQVEMVQGRSNHQPPVKVMPSWYF